MKFVFFSLAAVAGAVAPRSAPPDNTLPVQSGTESIPTGHLTILPITTVSDQPTSTDKITIPESSSDGGSTSLPTTYPHLPSLSPSSGSTSQTTSLVTSGSTGSHNSTTANPGTTTSAPTQGTGSTRSASASNTVTSSTPNAAAMQTVNVVAGIAAVAGLFMIA
ncbi:hypothetical protein NQ176_g8607 [Zarea fungicola]|uniref:Uncharacterized protein n=1 Tax=Zarea fungicola TaxID=93591 RepID=A0ACC1MS86_9HYPO|nr:hypothetical protein NQ176_g8607 [Lecanicillium fungicola]